MAITTKKCILDYDQNGLVQLTTYTDGAREIGISDLDSVGLKDNIDFVSWGFGPTADAGNDTTVECGDIVLLDASGSYKYAPNLQTLTETFGINTSQFSYEGSWQYFWWDESDPCANGDKLLGFGCRAPTLLCPGQHRIRLEVLGTLYPDPIHPGFQVGACARDWCTIVVNPPTEPFRIIHPNGGEIYSGGCQARLLWGPVCFICVRIELSTDSGLTWSTVADCPTNQGGYFWSIPKGISSSKCLLKVTQLGGNLSDISDNVFTIRPQASPMVHPANHSVGAPDSSSIKIFFGSDMDKSTINDSSLFVYSDMDGYAKLDITYDSQTTEATLVPRSSFSPGAHISVLLESFLKYTDHSRFCGPVSTSLTIGTKISSDIFGLDSTYRVGYHPQRAVAGDFDKDGDIDAAVVSSTLTSSYLVCVLLNDGSGKFARTDYEVSGGPYGITSVDIDMDLDLDLIVSKIAAPELSLLRNDGTGHFVVESIGLDRSVGSAYSVAAGDLNEFQGFGYLDLAIPRRDYGCVSILHNWGSYGLLKMRDDVDAGLSPTDIIIGDLDNDGDNDIATVNDDFNGSVSVLKNDGDGFASFDLDRTYAVKYFPNSITSADFDGDGDLDLATGHSRFLFSERTLTVLFNNGDGTFSRPVFYAAGLNPRSVTSADVNGDNSVDLICCNEDDDDVSILLNNGEGKFLTHLRYPVGHHPEFVTTADFNSDGAIDILTVNYSSGDVSILLNKCLTSSGDLNLDGNVSLGDIIHVVNYVFDKDKAPCLGIDPGNCWIPDPFCRGDVNQTGTITLGDIIHLVNYVFDKDRLPCLGSNPGNCWTPEASGACCLPVP